MDLASEIRFNVLGLVALDFACNLSPEDNAFLPLADFDHTTALFLPEPLTEVTAKCELQEGINSVFLQALDLQIRDLKTSPSQLFLNFLLLKRHP